MCYFYKHSLSTRRGQVTCSWDRHAILGTVALQMDAVWPILKNTLSWGERLEHGSVCLSCSNKIPQLKKQTHFLQFWRLGSPKVGAGQFCSGEGPLLRLQGVPCPLCLPMAEGGWEPALVSLPPLMKALMPSWGLHPHDFFLTLITS